MEIPSRLCFAFMTIPESFEGNSIYVIYFAEVMLRFHRKGKRAADHEQISPKTTLPFSLASVAPCIKNEVVIHVLLSFCFPPLIRDILRDTQLGIYLTNHKLTLQFCTEKISE